MTSIIVNRREIGNLMLSAAIRAVYDEEEDDEFDATDYRPCMAMVATRENLARIAVAADHEFAREVEIGTLIIVEPDEAPRSWPMGQHANSNIVIPVRDTQDGGIRYFDPFSAIGHERLHACLAEPVENENGRDGTVAAARAWLNMMSEHFADVRTLSAEDPESVPPGLQTQALVAGLTDRYGQAEFPNGLTPADLARYAQADSLRAEITSLDPAHADALPAERDIGAILAEDFDTGLEVGRGSSVRKAAYTQSADLIRMVRSNDRLCREVFGAMTSTPIEHLQCVRVSGGMLDQIGARMTEADARIKADWCQAVDGTLADIFSQTMQGYRYETGYFSTGGRDVLTVKDQGGGYLYSWPSSDRRPVMEIGNRLVAGIDPASIPSQEEVDRLYQVLDTLHAREARQDAGPDLGM